MLMQTLDDAAVIALLPGLVLALRRTGLPARLETAATVVSGVLLVCLVDLAAGGVAITTATVAGWIVTGLIDGLAAAGLSRMAPPRPSTSDGPAADGEGRRGRPLR